MAATLRFDNLTIAGTAIAASAFVSGSGRLSLTGDDVATTTADGRIHNDRRCLNARAECSAYGDQCALETDNGLGVACVFKRGTNTVRSATMAVSVAVSDAVDGAEISRLTFVGDAS